MTNRDVKLTIDGKSWIVPKDRSLTLDLDRAFAWQFDGGSQQVERIPDGQTTHEVLLAIDH